MEVSSTLTRTFHLYSELISITCYRTGYSQILGHAHAVDLYRKEFQASQKGQIGITLVRYGFPNLNSVMLLNRNDPVHQNCDWSEPLNESEEAKKSSKRYLDLVIGWFADPICKHRHSLNPLPNRGHLSDYEQI